MSVSITTFQSDLEKLIRKFEADQQHYSSKDYLEAQARMDLITPFFKALGWDDVAPKPVRPSGNERQEKTFGQFFEAHGRASQRVSEPCNHQTWEE